DNAGFAVASAERLLPELLRGRGYATGGVVSSYVLRKETGIGRGFAFFDDEMQPAPPDMAVGELRRDGAAAERIAERWLERTGTSRAFLFLHLFEPHKPYAPPPQFSGYAPDDAEVAYAVESICRLGRGLKGHPL